MENNTRDPIQQAKWHVLVVYEGWRVRLYEGCEGCEGCDFVYEGCSAQRGLFILDISQEGLKAITCRSFIFSSTWVWPFLKRSLTSSELCAVSQQPVDGGEPREMGRSTTGKRRSFSLNEDSHYHRICNYFSSDAHRYNNSPKSVELTS